MLLMLYKFEIVPRIGARIPAWESEVASWLLFGLWLVQGLGLWFSQRVANEDRG
jgi:hypothetical protein